MFNGERSIINENSTAATVLNLNITFEGAETIFLALVDPSGAFELANSTFSLEKVNVFYY